MGSEMNRTEITAALDMIIEALTILACDDLSFRAEYAVRIEANPYSPEMARWVSVK